MAEEKKRKRVEDDWYELRNLVYARQWPLALALLRRNPALKDLRNGIGETVLHFLAVENDIVGVAWLKDQGFLLDVCNKFGEPLLFEVASLQYKELLAWLYQQGADFGLKGPYDQTLYSYLVQHRKQEMAAFVVSFEARP